MAAMKPGGQRIESGVFLIRSESCSGWLEVTGNEMVTDLYYHGD